jgi:hypothetical protein
MTPTITYDGRSIVTASIRISSDAEFGDAVAACNAAVLSFPRSQPGSEWGCDGVGYECQRRLGLAVRHRSGVGPRKYKTAKAQYDAKAYAIA